MKTTLMLTMLTLTLALANASTRLPREDATAAMASTLTPLSPLAVINEPNDIRHLRSEDIGDDVVETITSVLNSLTPATSSSETPVPSSPETEEASRRRRVP
ncbi:hypothetical protein PHYPSEUDO_003219 [Phytophthora pseudosyringae]|uniref:RxLR effector protein n=1 Tax=Phytophthora pseudosyringae TaxID=221518 RepID=A0A8T1VSJ4_9STRA|nr:hypothetical protein PHYPSEUDO_003219 [Phytophthora pseudosyringae]